MRINSLNRCKMLEYIEMEIVKIDNWRNSKKGSLSGADVVRRTAGWEVLVYPYQWESIRSVREVLFSSNLVHRHRTRSETRARTEYNIDFSYRLKRADTRWPNPNWTADTCSCPSRGALRCWWSTWPPWCWRPTARCWSPWRPCRSPAPACCSDTRICSPGPGRSAGSRTWGSPDCPPSRGCRTRPWSRSLALRTRDRVITFVHRF